MTEFRINSSEGLPIFFITANVNEKMIEMLETETIPRLKELHVVSEEQKRKMDEDKDYPLFTLVFDREAYSPALFKKLWDNHRIAVITYRKNVKESDAWDKTEFKDVDVYMRFGKTTMKLHEKQVTLDGYTMREVRRLTPGGHQTSIVTNNKKLNVESIAGYMFGRWVQENFFRYFRQDYAFDKIIQYAVDKVDESVMVVNREYSNVQSEIKKQREKLYRIKANLYELHENALNETDDTKEHKPQKKSGVFNRSIELTEKRTQTEQEIERLIEKRSKLHYKIPVGQMPESVRYTKLHQESKYLMNILKMICYRAETALANKLAPHFNRSDDEIRMLVKAIMHLSINIRPDMDSKLLHITLYPLSNQRSQLALSKIIEEVNATDTIFPGSLLTMKFEIATTTSAPSQEF